MKFYGAIWDDKENKLIDFGSNTYHGLVLVQVCTL